MHKKTTNRISRPCVIDALESRTLLSTTPAVAASALSAARGPELHAAMATPSTTTTLHVSAHNTKLGLPVIFSITVKAAKRFGTPAGIVEILDGGNIVQGAGGGAAASSGAKNRASYTFSPGNVALYIGKQTFAAEFISSNSLPSSTSKNAIVNVTVPKVTTAADGLETATVKKGHGAAIQTGQTATVLYSGFLASTGTLFDYASAHSPGTLPYTAGTGAVAGGGFVVQGFSEGTAGMKVGETRILAVPAALGYGADGAGNGLIPANANLVFLVTLLSIG